MMPVHVLPRGGVSSRLGLRYPEPEAAGSRVLRVARDRAQTRAQTQ